MSKIKSIYLVPVVIITFVLLVMCAFSVFGPIQANADQNTTYIDIDLNFGSSNVYTGAAMPVTAKVWESEDKNTWVESDFVDYVINYYEGAVKLSSVPSAVGTYTARAVATADTEGLYTSQNNTLIKKDTVINSFTYNILYNHFAISYIVPNSLVADGNDHIGEVGASIFCGSAALTKGTDFSVQVLFEGSVATEVIAVGEYTIKVTMLEDFATSNISKHQVFEYKFSLVANEVSASLQKDKLYYDGQANAPTINSIITTEPIFSNKYDIYYISKKVNSTNGYSKSLIPPVEVGEYICRIQFSEDIAEYGLLEDDHIDLSFQIVPKPYKIIFQGDSANFDDNNAIIKQSESGMTITASFVNQNGDPLSITANDYTMTYWYFDKLENDFLDLPTGIKPINKGRYQVRLTFNKDIPQAGQNVFGSAHSEYKIFEDDVIIYEFQIVNAITYITGTVASYTGHPVVIDTSLQYGSLPINNSPSDTIFEVRYIYGGGENILTPTNIGNYVGVVRFLKNFSSGGKIVAAAGDEYRFFFEVRYSSPIISISYESGSFEIGCSNVESFEEGVDYSLSHFVYQNGVYQAAQLSAVGTYRTILTIIKENKAKGLIVGDIYTKVITIAGGNPEAIRLVTSNLDYNGNAKPVAPSFGTGITRTLHTDYSIAYYRYINGVIDAQCGYPTLPGSYRAVLTFNKADSHFGVPTGYKVTEDFVIIPMNFKVTFTPQDEDLVYNKTEKYFDASFTANNRPISIVNSAYTIKYRAHNSTDYSDFSEVGFVNAGTYRVAVIFDTDVGYEKYGISIIENSYVKEQLFTIDVLTVRLNFGLPVEEESMYRETGVEPKFEFFKTNNGMDELSAVVVKNIDFEVKYQEGDLYGMAYDETPIVGIPVSTNRYLAKLAIYNSNIRISGITKEIIGAYPQKNYDDICYISIDESEPTIKAQAAYRIIPLPLAINANFPESMFEDGTPKGCEFGDLDFETIDVFSMTEGQYDSKTVSNATFSDFVNLEYYKRESGGTRVIGNPLASAPTKAGDYTLRVNFAKAVGEDDDPYVFSCYRIVNGMDWEGDFVDLPIQTGYYYDISFRIQEPDEIRVVFIKPASFAFDGTPKAFEVSFAPNDINVTISSEDYDIVYYSQLGVYSPTAFSEVTKSSDLYTVQISFNKDFAQYKIVQIEGVYHKVDPSVSTITENDVVSYSYRIFAPFELQWEWVAPNNLYYDGTNKAFGVRFFDANNPAATVTLIKNIDYSIRYYKKVSENNYSILLNAPILPQEEADSYVAEIVFLRELQDYRILKENDETLYEINSYITAKQKKDDGESNPVGLTLQDNGGSFTDEMQKERRHNEFCIHKAVLVVSGISVKNKSFDNTTDAEITGKPVLTIKKDVSGKPMGGKVIKNGEFLYVLDNAIVAKFVSAKTGNNIEVVVANSYNLSDGGNYYILEYQPLKANITKLEIKINPITLPRQYNPFFVDAENLLFDITNKAKSVLASILQITEEECLDNAFVGGLSRVGANGVNDNVGEYDILIGTLALVGGEFVLSDLSTSTLAENITLSLVPTKYKIIPRNITITVNENQYKYYGDADPVQGFEFSVTSGALLFNDVFVGRPSRQSNESTGTKDKVGFYDISLSAIRIFDRNGEGVDVTSNYKITRVSKPFEVRKKELKVAANNQTITFGQGEFNPIFVKVGGIPVTPTNINSILKGDVFAGALGLEDTGTRTALIARKYKITRGTLCIKDTSGKDVTHNYDLIFDTAQSATAYLVVEKYTLNLKLNTNAVLTKIYGDKDPKISFSVLGGGLPSGYTFHSASTLGRTAGENVGTYKLLANNSTEGIKILDSGRNVTDYFNIEVNVNDDQNKTITFAIMPRHITLGIRSETIIKSNKTILPSLVYYDSDGKELLEDIVNTLKVKYAVPNLEFVEGENVITPEIIGTVREDDNFVISVLSGTINVIYPENTTTQERIDNEDILFVSNRMVYSDFRVFNSVAMYRVDTQNGENPTRSVTTSVPVTEELAGKNVYVVAVYADGTINLLNASIENNEIIFEDDQFCYIIIGTLAVWPYIVIIVVVAVFVVGGATMLISFLVRRKKRIALGLVQPKQKRSKKKKTTSADKELSLEEIEREVKQSTQPDWLDADNEIALTEPLDTDSDELIISANVSRLKEDIEDTKTPELNKEHTCLEDNAKEDLSNAQDVIDIEIKQSDGTEEIIKSSSARRFEEDVNEDEED